MQYLMIFAMIVNIYEITGYKFLIALPFASKSLHNLFTSLGDNLAQSGHEVDILTIFEHSAEHPNVRTSAPSEKITEIPSNDSFAQLPVSESLNLMKELVNEMAKNMWEDPNSTANKLWKERNTFDALIMPSYYNEVVFPFLLDFNGSFILVCTPGVEYFSISYSGNWLPPSVVPSVWLPFDENMNFFERCTNYIMLILNRVVDYIYFTRPQEKALQLVFPNMGSLSSYYDRADFTLINGHFALDSPLPLLPNQVEIGTINAHEARPLDQELEDFMEASGDAGVIYMSFGSLIKGNDMPGYLFESFVSAFKRLPQRVLWKFEDDKKATVLPSNVLTRKWFPQQDVLGHPKTRLFISHCGNLGTQEAKYHGVPILAVPVFFDQPRNAARMVKKGYALSLDFNTIDADKIVDAVNVLINDTSYSDRLKHVSRLLRDQKETPGERAVWWIEYVVRHKGAPHLRYPGKRLHFLQYVGADVLLFYIVCLITAVYSVNFIRNKLCLLLRRRSAKVKNE